MATDLARLSAYTERQAAQRRSIVEKLLRLLLGLWGDFSDARDPNLVAGNAAASASLVDAALAQTRLLTRTYLASVLREMGITDLRLPPIVDLYPRSDVSELDVYSRPATQFVYALSQGKTVEEARDAATQRLEAIATQDVKAADRDESQKVYQAVKKVIGYRRVPHPELSDTGTCGLCWVASQQLYATDELMPLHGPSCNCTTLPVVKGDDPGLQLNRDDLDALYSAAGGNDAESLREVRVKVNEHGELGPILTNRGEHFKGPKESGATPYEKPTPASARAEKTKERARLADELEAAQTAYNTIRDADPDGVPPGGDAGLRMFRATKSLRERMQRLDQVIAKLPA